MKIRKEPTLTLAAMCLCSPAVANQHQPYFRDFPEMSFVCKSTQVENEFVFPRVDPKTGFLYVYHDADHMTPYRLSSYAAEPDMHAVDEFGIPLTKTLPWDMVMLFADDRNVVMNKNEGIWLMQEHDHYYHCIPTEPYWRAYEALDPPKR